MPRPITRRTFLRGAASGLAGSVLTAAYADYDVHDIRLEQVELRLKRWKADGLRVGFITDIHVNDPDEVERAVKAAEMLIETSPDLLLFGGDCVNSTTPIAKQNIVDALKPFEKLKCPKLAVLGNHDYWSGMIHQIEATVRDSGFQVLKNEVVEFDHYAVAGYDDRIGGVRDPNFQPRQESLISLMHEPDDVDFVPETASVQFSGHSHGGQICIPFGIILHTPKLSRKYRRGFFPDSRVPLYVSRGVGTTGFKWRMFCPPEVTLFTLRSEK
ncbi:MAG TPA: metallophosphoesterase [Fimbriimonadaceae bacterium]|nr:metallophosphoesterase [Fimbriimonadaceae bacterium]